MHFSYHFICWHLITVPLEHTRHIEGQLYYFTLFIHLKLVFSSSLVECELTVFPACMHI